VEALDKGIAALTQALLEQGFRPVDQFDLFVTFMRDDDPVKIHVGPDGSFAAFDSDDELLTEGEGAEDLYRALVAKAVPANKRRPRASVAARAASKTISRTSNKMAARGKTRPGNVASRVKNTRSRRRASESP
jgi:hypothetical protein